MSTHTTSTTRSSTRRRASLNTQNAHASQMATAKKMSMSVTKWNSGDLKKSETDWNGLLLFVLVAAAKIR